MDKGLQGLLASGDRHRAMVVAVRLVVGMQGGRILPCIWRQVRGWPGRRGLAVDMDQLAMLRASGVANQREVSESRELRQHASQRRQEGGQSGCASGVARGRHEAPMVATGGRLVNACDARGASAH